MKRRIPRLRSDEEAQAFIDSDLSDLDFAQFKSGRLQLEERARSEIYQLFERAIIEKKQLVCMYNGRHRELCPIILGHSNGEEKALTYQFAGEGKSGVPSGGKWKCFRLAGISEVHLRDGPWLAGSRHSQKQTCVEVVDLDVNPDSPYNPKRRLADLAKVQTNPADVRTRTPNRTKPRAPAK